MDKALDAARPPRELLWNEYCDEQGQPGRWDAETPFNTYYGIALLHDGYSVQHDYADVAKALPSLNDAKTAAVSDCSRRCSIYLSALPTTDTSGLVERLRLIGYEATDKVADRIEALEREVAGIDAERRGALDLCLQRNAEIQALNSRNATLLSYARETDCPRPCNGRPDDFTAVQCVEAGECGCGALAALTGGSDGE